MILCMNLNAAIDKTALVSPFRLDQIHRPQQVIALPGGKGANVARALKALGESPVVSGWIGGFAGQFIESGLHDEGIETAFVHTSAESRTCLSIVDEANDTLTELYERGEPIPLDKVDALRDWFRAEIGKYDAVTLCGSLPAGVPPGFYAELIAIAREHHVPALLDTSAEALRQGVAAGPYLIKPNKQEFSDLFGTSPASLDEFVAAAIEVSKRFSSVLVLSLGEDGALAIDDERVLHAHPPKLAIRSAVGSGDCLLAAFARGLTRQFELEDALADGVAAGTANTLQYGAGIFSPEDFERIRSQVTIVRL